MRFSARSFSELEQSPSRSASSSAGVAPRGRVPLIGLDSTTRLVPIVKKRSGEALSTASSGKRRKAPYGTGLTRRRCRYARRGSISASAVAAFVRQTS